MTNALDQLSNLSANERLAVTELLNRLAREHSHSVLQVIIYGSGVQGNRGPESDVDLLIITRRDDWQEHEPIRFLAAHLSNKYDVFLSVRVISRAHDQRMQSVQPLLYQNIRRDGLELLRYDDRSGLVEHRLLPAA